MPSTNRNNVRIGGAGPATIVFAHGFGCDSKMWRRLAPLFEDRFRTVVFDLVGSGGSDLAAYDRRKYGSLRGYADDLVEMLDELEMGPVIFVGHSVSAMIGLLASIEAPARFRAQVLVGSSPCYVNDLDYVGGFSRDEIDGLLETLETNYLGWSSTMAPAFMGAPEQPELGAELADSLSRNDPDIARHFARVTFLADHRADLCKSTVPALILQSREDLVVPGEVAHYLHRHVPNSSLELVDNIGHYPHLSASADCLRAIDTFLLRTLS